MATIFPLSASVGQEFEGYIYDGTIWNLIGNEYNPTVYSAYEPDNPKPGDLWVDSSVDVPTFALNDYLTIESASSTYATKDELNNVSVDLTGYATESYVNTLSNYSIETASAAAVGYLIDGAPTALNTLNELSAALNDDSNFATTVTNSLSEKAPIVNPVFTNNIQVNGQIDLLMSGSTSLVNINGFTGMESELYITSNDNFYIQGVNGYGAVTAKEGVSVSSSNKQVILSGLTGEFINSTASANQIATIGNLESKQDKDISIVETNANSYTFKLSDAGKLVLANGGNENVLYIPSPSTVNFPIGTQINIFQLTSPTVIIYVSDPQTTILYPNSGIDLRAQYSAATIIKIKSDTWIIIGDL